MVKPPLLIGVIGVALTAILGYNSIYGPFQRQVGLIRTQLTEEQTTQRTQAEVAALFQQVEQHRKRLSQEPEPSWLVREVMALSQKAGVQLTSINQEPLSPTEQFTRLTVTLQVSASYHQFGAFLDELEHSDRFIQVDRVRMSRFQQIGPVGIEVTLSTLYLPPVLNAASPG